MAEKKTESTEAPKVQAKGIITIEVFESEDGSHYTSKSSWTGLNKLEAGSILTVVSRDFWEMSKTKIT